MTNNKFKPVQIRKKIHNKIAVLATMNDITMKMLTSKMLEFMFEKYKDEIEQIIKEIKIKKS